MGRWEVGGVDQGCEHHLHQPGAAGHKGYSGSCTNIHWEKAPFPRGMRQLQGQLATGMTSHRTLWLHHLSQPLIQVQRVARSRALPHILGSALMVPSSIFGLV